MTAPKRGANEFVREVRAAVREALARSHKANAWKLLQERDADDNAKGALPYTEPALAELAAAHQRDPDDIGIVHHLAIAHHARAWDWELQGDLRAAIEWERALGYWRIVAAASEFWASLKAKLRACDPNADPTWLDEVRQNLLEHLLEIHVDFVRHYCESDKPDGATAHVELVRRARIPPAVKRRLVDKVFQAMTGAVPEARAKRHYDSALTMIERFLKLFPDHLPALRMHAEVCKEWVSGMSYQDDWDDIICIGARAEPYARRLAAHPELGDEPLAQTALEELAYELALRGRDRGESYFAKHGSNPISVADRDLAKTAIEFGLKWGQLGAEHSPRESQVRAVLAACLADHAYCLYLEASEVMQSDIDPMTKIAAAEPLLRGAVAEMEEALAYSPEDQRLNENLTALRQTLSTLESQKKMFRLFGN